jgi:hypothetical protein
MFVIFLFFVLHLYSLYYSIGEWDPPSQGMIQPTELSQTPDEADPPTESGVEDCPEELWCDADRKAIVYNYNRDTILVLGMYAFRCKFLEVSYVNVFYMVVEAL